MVFCETPASEAAFDRDLERAVMARGGSPEALEPAWDAVATLFLASESRLTTASFMML